MSYVRTSTIWFSIHPFVCHLFWFPPIRGRPSIYFPIADHVNVYCWQSKSLVVMATSQVVACHITKLPSGFRQILQFRFRENIEYAPHQKWQKSRRFCIHLARIILPLTYHMKPVFLHNIIVVHKYVTQFRKHFFMDNKNTQTGYRNKIIGIFLVRHGRSILYYPHPFVCLYVFRKFPAPRITPRQERSSSSPSTWAAWHAHSLSSLTRCVVLITLNCTPPFVRSWQTIFYVSRFSL